MLMADLVESWSIGHPLELPGANEKMVSITNPTGPPYKHSKIIMNHTRILVTEKINIVEH